LTSESKAQEKRAAAYKQSKAAAATPTQIGISSGGSGAVTTNTTPIHTLKAKAAEAPPPKPVSSGYWKLIVPFSIAIVIGGIIFFAVQKGSGFFAASKYE